MTPPVIKLYSIFDSLETITYFRKVFRNFLKIIRSTLSTKKKNKRTNKRNF